MAQRIGITGARGFIGSYLLRHVLSAPDIGAVRALQRTAAVSDRESMAEIVVGDLLSPADCARFARDLDLIFYLAHRNTPVTSDFDQPNDALMNLVPLLTLVKAIEELGTKPHIVYFSSGGAVYGRNPSRVPFREADPCAPVSSYGIQKLAAEHYLRLASERVVLTCSTLRIGNAFGALLPQSRLQGLLGVAINEILHERPVRVFGNLENVRDYIHLNDICTAAMRAARARESYSVFNVGSARGYSVAETLEIVRECIGSPEPLNLVRHEGLGRDLTDWVVLDISKARDELGWAPSISLRDGIHDMIAERRRQTQSVSSTAW